MKFPNLYINVSQTIFAVLAAGIVANYIFREDFRADTNALILGLTGR